MSDPVSGAGTSGRIPSIISNLGRTLLGAGTIETITALTTDMFIACGTSEPAAGSSTTNPPPRPRRNVQQNTQQIIQQALLQPENVRRSWLEACHTNILQAQIRQVTARGAGIARAESEVAYWTQLATALQRSLGIINQGQAYQPPQTHRDHWAGWFNTSLGSLHTAQNGLLTAVTNNNERNQARFRSEIDHWVASAIRYRQLHGGQLPIPAQVQTNFQQLLAGVNEQINAPGTAADIRTRLTAFRTQLTNAMTTLNIPQQPPNP